MNIPSEDADPNRSWMQRFQDKIGIEASQPIVRAIAANAGWLMFERIGIQAIRFFVGIWVIRYLGPEGYGVYSYSVSFVVLAATFSALGLDNIVTRECARDRYESGRVLATAFWLRGAAAIIIAGLTIGGIFVLEEDVLVKSAVSIIAFRMIFESSFVADFWFRSQIESKYSVAVRTAGAVVAASLQVGAILLDASVLVFLGILVAQSAVQALGFAIMMYRHGPPVSSLAPSAEIGKQLLRDSWPLMISAFSTMVYMKMDQIMLKQMSSSEAVGIYASAAKLSELWYFIPVALTNSVFPEIVRLKEEAESKKYLERVQQFYDLIGGVVYAVTITVTLSAPYVVPLLFDDAYTGATAILQIHVWSFIFIGLGFARGKWLVAENLTRFAMAATLLGATVNVGLNLWLIPNYQGIGAAWATLISYAIYAYFSLLLSRKTRVAFVQMTKAFFAPIRYLMR